MVSQTTFRFASYRDFKRSLGKINAASECTELAIRAFIASARKASSSNEFIQQLSSTYNVRVDDVDIETLSAQISQHHVVSVHQQFELFLRQFRSEHPITSWEKDDAEDVLKNTLQRLGDGFAATAALVGRLEIDVSDYYRRVRNKFIHALQGEVLVDAEGLRRRVQECADYHRLSAPNEYSAIGFDDFVLFTRVTKRIALQLCSVARPTDEEIVNMLHKTEADGYAVKILIHRFRHEPERLNNALATLLRERFSLEKQESEPIIGLILGR